MNLRPEEISTLIKDQIKNYRTKIEPAETGTVILFGDGIAKAHGLRSCVSNELLEFDNGIKAIVMNLEEDNVGAVLLGPTDKIKEGFVVKRTKRIASIRVGEDMLGRVIDPLGEPLDGKGLVGGELYDMPLERKAPGVIYRQPVNQPLQTGLKAVDAMIPIGRGQRELIIGDRQTGKTAIALDAMLNQKGKNVICVYVAIGQKASSVAQLVENLRKRDAMDYCVVVSATAGEADTMQYIAPYAGCAMAEYYMHKGRDVLIVYDDLSKHAIAYRAMSLLLERAPGREAYPGDVFYLHSRLLERSAHLSDKLGGGSMTALPIVETQAGDVSAYIPTNIISITDGQIFFESELFYSGQRPAVNVGLSVSRVGGAAQSEVMRKSVGSIRLDLAQYREMQVFSRFGGELDEQTVQRLKYGEGLMQLLRQKNQAAMPLWEQVVTLICAQEQMFLDVPVKKIKQAQKDLLTYFSANCNSLCLRIEHGKKYSAELHSDVVNAAKDFFAAYSA